ncbi:response regulator [Sulfurospirillum arcachonense]|uniref:response regulator n=1 Tax=Sulfurospirillum arcachonense TaxID=57666 RepID=UPI00046AA897|nr:response regulator [Sulfurospirillum arcachonense]
MVQVLIVDDNDNNRLTIDLLLESLDNIETCEAADGKEAVELCKTKKIDLVFMDIMMPIMDGIEATKIINEISPSSMIIALSALDDKESKQTMLISGAQDYLTKPIDSDLFIQRTKNYINIINLRQNQIDNQDASNPFTTSVYDRKITFFMKNEESIVQFWDFFLQHNIYNCMDLSDYIRIVYGFSRWLIKDNVQFTIDVESNESNVYIMINDIGSLKKGTINNIIHKYIPNALFTIQDKTLTFKLLQIQTVENETLYVNDEAKNILSKTHINNISAEEFIENTAISILPKIDSLENIEFELDTAFIAFELNPTKDMLHKACIIFDEYHDVLELLVEFEHLAFAIKSLISFLDSLDDEKLQSDKVKNLVSLLLLFLNDLSSWRENIFTKQEALDVHYLDASLLSSCIQIEALFDEKDIEEGDDLEFF